MDYLTVDDIPSEQQWCIISLASSGSKFIGLKVRGTYGTIEVAQNVARQLYESDPYHSVYVTNTGYWTTFPDTELSEFDAVLNLKEITRRKTKRVDVDAEPKKTKKIKPFKETTPSKLSDLVKPVKAVKTVKAVKPTSNHPNL